MAIKATSESTANFKPIEPGTYLARAYQMIHIGTIQEEFNGEKKIHNKIRITWELPTELKQFKEGEPERPLVISKEFTLSMHEKATLRAYLKSWRGKDFTEDEAKSFDVTKLLGVACMISVTNKESKGKLYAEISGVSPVMKGITVPPQVNKTMEFNYDNFDMEVFKTFPDFLRTKMESSLEFKAISDAIYSKEHENKITAMEHDNEDLPF
ncbi:MAG: hypothetical protein PX635_00865 [Nostocales cyanobacterium LE14-WE12]|jgi:hypothetical protein|nr:hypothetical protein [Nostocales cyanobacterium LE14-WE12]